MVYYATQSPFNNNRVIVAPMGRNSRHTRNRATLVCRRGGFHFRKKNQEFRLAFDVPGVKPRDLEVKVEDGILHISGPRKGKGKFCKMYAVKRFDITKLTANLSDGVLTVTAPRIPAAEPKTIPVTEGSHPEQSKDQYQLLIDGPGIKANDIKIELKDGLLKVSAARKIKKEGKDVTVSRFFNEFSINPNEVETSQIKAILESGVLMVVGPKKNNDNEQTIPVVPKALEDESTTKDESTAEETDETASSDDTEEK